LQLFNQFSSQTIASPSMTQDRIGKAKSWCIEVAEATPVGVEVAPTWADVGRLIGDIVRAIDPSRALPWFESYADQDRIIKM